MIPELLRFALIAAFLAPFVWAASGDKISFQAAPGNSDSIAVDTELFAIDENGNMDLYGSFTQGTSDQFVINSSGQIITAGGTTRVNTKEVRFGYRYFVSTPTSYWSDSATNNPFVKLGTAGYLLSPTEVTFPVSASEATFDPGKWISFQYWRVRDEGVVDKARHLMARFSYNPEY